MFEVLPLGRPVAAVVRPPGSKSLTNRALVAAALAPSGSASRLAGPLEADDTRVMRDALRALGVLIDDVDDPWLVLGTGGDLMAPPAVVDVGASGTTARFITALAALAKGVTTIDGTERMRQRPIGPLVEALTRLGVDAESAAGFPPVTIEGGRLAGGHVEIDASLSSQFVSALMLVAPMADSPTELSLAGPVVSRPYLDSTVQVMTAFGADVRPEADKFIIAATGYHKAHFEVEADASAAAYPAVAAAIAGGTVDILGIPATSLQPDLLVIRLLGEMGCEVSFDPDRITVKGPTPGLRPLNADLGGAPDGAMALAVAALFADGESSLGGLGTLRWKETDRLAALRTEIRRLGGRAEVEGDTLYISPGTLHGAEIDTYDDHRMAMSFALAGLVVPGVSIREPEVVSKTWPAYFRMLSSL